MTRAAKDLPLPATGRRCVLWDAAMESRPLHDLVGPDLAEAFARKGYEALTAVQEAVLAPELEGHDLRISSQTGSGKTVAIGLALRRELEGGPQGAPRALVIVPTRELAQQVEQELRWLFAPRSLRVVSVTGGSSPRDERRSLAQGTDVVVGTPGRLLDHLDRGGVDPSHVRAVVLDEADRLLDMGFRDDLRAILMKTPEGRRTHLVSATFPPEVRALADEVQKEPTHVEGTRLGAANQDIEHVVHLVEPGDRLAALVDLLLAWPDASTLVFVRTRADAADLAGELAALGFDVSPLSGDMEQAERNRALAAFRRGDLHALVATDVAARGIDVQDIGRVIHFDPPEDADTYTHRAGRTGRAGRKGTSALLVLPRALARTTAILRRAKAEFRFEPLPDPDEIRARAAERLMTDLAGGEGEVAPHFRQLAKRIAEGPSPERAIARLLVRARAFGPTEPRPVRFMEPPRAPELRRGERPIRGGEREEGPRRPPRSPRGERAWTPFRVSWGSEHGADARRLFALSCRRGAIDGADIGAIRVARNYSVVEIASEVAGTFAEAAGRPDPRDPRVRFRREEGGSPAARAPASAEHPASRPSRSDFPPKRASSRAVPKQARPKWGSAEREGVESAGAKHGGGGPRIAGERAGRPKPGDARGGRKRAGSELVRGKHR
jgi:ATP-dependent RNA helicase DeaD